MHMGCYLSEQHGVSSVLYCLSWRKWSLFTYPLERRRSGAPVDHNQTPSLCYLLFSELSSSLPVGCFLFTFRPARAALLVTVRPTVWQSVCCGCWMCWPTQLRWHWFCRGTAHFRDFNVLLLLLFQLQRMLLVTRRFLCKLCCIGVGMKKLEC